jgi:hypothetical protein
MCSIAGGVGDILQLETLCHGMDPDAGAGNGGFSSTRRLARKERRMYMSCQVYAGRFIVAVAPSTSTISGDNGSVGQWCVLLEQTGLRGTGLDKMIQVGLLL